MDNLPDIGGNLEDIITQTLARRRKRMEDVSPKWGVDLSPEQVGATASGEPITMDAPTVRRTEDLPPGFVRDGARMTGPSGAFTELGTPRIVRKAPGAMARTEVAADGAEMSPLMAQLMAIQGPGEVMAPESVQAAKQAYAARGGEFARGTLPTVEAAKTAENNRQRDLMERLERQAQGAADTSKATSSDGPPDTEPLYRQAFLEQLRNVGRAARGEQTVRVASPELAARDELAKWLAGKREREAGAAKLAQEERLEQMRSLLGLAREEAATGRTKMQTEADVKRAEIAAGAKAAPKGVGKPPAAPKPAEPKQRELPPAMVAEFASYGTATDALDRLLETYKTTKMDTPGGRMSAMAAGLGMKNTDASPYLAEARTAMQGVGTILEGGKLAAGDEAKYAKMLPEPGDSLDIARKKVADVKRLLTDKRTRALKDLSAAGYRTPEVGAPAAAAPAGLAAGHVTLTDENGTEYEFDSEAQAEEALKKHPNLRRP